LSGDRLQNLLARPPVGDELPSKCAYPIQPEVEVTVKVENNHLVAKIGPHHAVGDPEHVSHETISPRKVGQTGASIANALISDQLYVSDTLQRHDGISAEPTSRRLIVVFGGEWLRESIATQLPPNEKRVYTGKTASD